MSALEKTKRDRFSLGEERAGRPMVIISESGLYKLIMRSDKAEARAFQDWATREVLPSIRKTDSYVAPGAEAPATTSPAAEEGDMTAIDHLHLQHRSYPRDRHRRGALVRGDRYLQGAKLQQTDDDDPSFGRLRQG
ncbi:BRO-N domain-containing protein [Roseobacteraceae bacterium NS-SX3]